MPTKILALTDALGNLVRFVLLPGHRLDTVGVPPLIDGVSFGALIADTAFDSNAIIADLNERGAEIVIAQHPRRTMPLPLDTGLYKWRHPIENFFCKLKAFNGIAMRADKTDQSFTAAIHLAAAVINSRRISTIPKPGGKSDTVALFGKAHPKPLSRGTRDGGPAHSNTGARVNGALRQMTAITCGDGFHCRAEIRRGQASEDCGTIEFGNAENLPLENGWISIADHIDGRMRASRRRNAGK